MSQLSDNALSIAISQVGQKENPLGSNWGHPVEEYIASVGLNEPVSWCMCFMYWCFGQASKGLSITNPMTKTAGVVHAWQVAYPEHKITADPQAGDIFIMDFGGGHGHTGIVESVDPDGTLHTVEGNTDLTGSPNGDGVYRRVRHFRPPILGFLRYP